MPAPLFDSRPSPLERRRTISAASLGLLETMRCLRSRSYQRNAGIPSFVPWRIPAWLPDVIEGSIASHWESRWLPSRIQPAIVLTESGSNAGGEDRVGEAIDLDDHQGGLVGLRRRSLGHEARDQQAEVRPVAVDPEDRRQQRVEGREHERPDQGGEEPVHLDALCQRGDHEKREDLQEEDEDPQQQQRMRSDECQEDRADDGVEEGHEDDRDDRISETPDRDPGEEPRRQHERDGRDEQGDHQALEQRPRATAPLPQDAGLGRVEVDQPSHCAERSRSPPRRGEPDK